MKKTYLLILIIALAFIAVGALLLNQGALKAFAYEHTGEEALIGQIRGMVQLLGDVTRPDPVTEAVQLIPLSDVNPFGMNTFLHNEVEISKREEVLRLLSEAGFYWVREQFPWEDIEIHAQGDFVDRRNDPAGVDAWAKYDNIVDLVESYGMELIVRLDNPPSWSRSQPDDVVGGFAPPDDYDDFAAYAATVAERYKGRIHYYQIWNEPNIYPEWGEQAVSPENYTDLLCRAYSAIKEVDPEAVVLSGTLAPTSEITGRDFNDFLFLQRMYDAGAESCFDILTVQGYGLWSGPTDHRMRPIVINIARNVFIRDIMVKNGDAEKPIWISELNWNAAPEDVTPVYGRVTLEQQARYAPLAYLRAEEEWPWVGAVCFWYFKRPDFSWLDERRPEAYFQMADPDFNLMPVYDSMKSFITGSAVVHEGIHAANHWAVDYGEGWRVEAPYEGTSVLSDVADAQAVFYFYGEEFAIAFEGETLEVSIDGGEWQSLAPEESGEVIWRGALEEHHVTLKAPRGSMILWYRIFRGDGPIISVLAIGVILISGIIIFSGWKDKSTEVAKADGDA